MRPKWIKVEENVAAAVLGMVAEIFGPIGAIGDLRRRPQDCSRPARQIAQLLDERELVVLVPQRRQPAKFRTDQESVDPACDGRQMRKMENEATIAPVARRSVEDHRALLLREI